jgi:hypothetical protein
MIFTRLAWWLRLQRIRFAYHSLHRRLRIQRIRKIDLPNPSHGNTDDREIFC